MTRSLPARPARVITRLLAAPLLSVFLLGACSNAGDGATNDTANTADSLAGLTITVASTAGAVLSETFWSQSLGTNKRMRVYLPPSYRRDSTRRYPVVYYLHGLTGNEDDWVKQGQLPATMDSLIAAGGDEMIIVMPDGDNSWYTTWHALPDMAACRNDSTRRESVETFCVPWPHYDDYIARDLVAFVDERFRTKAERAHRAIAGLSMGGYGAITLALRYPTVYVAAASHSGVLAPALVEPRTAGAPARLARSITELRDVAARRYAMLESAFGPDTISWYAREPGRLAGRLVTAGTALPALRIDCGLNDSLLSQNQFFVTTLRTLGVSHEYAEHPGGHEWTYWRDRLPGSLRWLMQHVATASPNDA